MFSAFESSEDDSDELVLGSSRRSRRGALWLLAVVLVIVVVTVLLVRLVDTGPGTPSGPGVAAQRWVQETLSGHFQPRSTTCDDALYNHMYEATKAGATARAGAVHKTSPDHWTVSVHVEDPAQTIQVQVERHRNRFVVC